MAFLIIGYIIEMKVISDRVILLLHLNVDLCTYFETSIDYIKDIDTIVHNFFLKDHTVFYSAVSDWSYNFE